MQRIRSIVALVLLLGADRALAQQNGVDALIRNSRVLPERNCARQPSEGEGIVVCGRRDENQFRIPEELRSSLPRVTERSWDARTREFGVTQRFEDQVSGPGAWLNGAKQRDCQYREERQAIAGRPTDCTRGRPIR